MFTFNLFAMNGIGAIIGDMNWLYPLEQWSNEGQFVLIFINSFLFLITIVLSYLFSPTFIAKFAWVFLIATFAIGFYFA